MKTKIKITDIVPHYSALPDLYSDWLFHFLTDAELRVIIYAVRRVFGFGKSQDRISISQFAYGITSKDGERVDYGASVSYAAASKALQSLEKYRVVVKIAENDTRVNHGALYRLETDGDKVDWDGLAERLGVTEAAQKEKMNKPRQALANKRAAPPSIPQRGVESETPPLYHRGDPLYGIEATPSIPQRDNRQIEKQIEKQVKQIGSQPPLLEVFEDAGVQPPIDISETVARRPEEVHRQRTLDALARGVNKNLELAEQLRQLFHIDPDPNRKATKEFMNWLKDRPRGQTLQGFAEWWFSKANWRSRDGSPPTLGQVRELWMQAYPPKPSAQDIEEKKSQQEDDRARIEKVRAVQDALVKVGKYMDFTDGNLTEADLRELGVLEMVIAAGQERFIARPVAA